MNRTNDKILHHDDDALLSEKHIRPFEFLKNLSESDSIRPCLVTEISHTGISVELITPNVIKLPYHQEGGRGRWFGVIKN